MVDVFVFVVRRDGGDDKDVGDLRDGDLIEVDDYYEHDNNDVVHLPFFGLDGIPVVGTLVVPVVFGPVALILCRRCCCSFYTCSFCCDGGG